MLKIIKEEKLKKDSIKPGGMFETDEGGIYYLSVSLHSNPKSFLLTNLTGNVTEEFYSLEEVEQELMSINARTKEFILIDCNYKGIINNNCSIQ